MLINLDNTRLYNRLYSVTGSFCCVLMIVCFYQQSGDPIICPLPKLNTFIVFVAVINRSFIHLYRGGTTLIPIDLSSKLTASQHPAVSSLEDYPTPAN